MRFKSLLARANLEICFLGFMYGIDLGLILEHSDLN